jgi:hypothetical protein
MMGKLLTTLGLVGAIGGLVGSQMPEIRRYMKMRSM